MDFHPGQSPYPEVCQTMATLFLGISPLHTGASVVLLLPQVSSPGGRAYQAIISIGVKVEGLSIVRQGAGGAKEALASAHGCRATKLETTTLFVLAPVNYIESSKTGVCAIIGEVNGTVGDSINLACGV